MISRSVVVIVLLMSFAAVSEGPRHVLLFIGDGMGQAQMDVASIFAYGRTNRLQFQSLPYSAEMTVNSATSEITDSAAASTAMASGVKVKNGVISMAIPGDGLPLKTVLEIARDHGKSTGLVTTTTLTHATPAAFGAHVDSRSNVEGIAENYLFASQPNVLLGGGGAGLSVEVATDAGYTVVQNQTELDLVEPDLTWYLAGLFGEGNMPYVVDGLDDYPSLATMTQAALRHLELNESGFFLMVEGGRIDHASHSNNIERCIGEVLAFEAAVSVGMQWAEQHEDTLLIVTADHETGGLEVIENLGEGVLPIVNWSTTGHTSQTVSLFGIYQGPLWGDVEFFDPEITLIDNTDVFGMMTRTPPKVPAISPWGKRALIGLILLTGVILLTQSQGHKKKYALLHGNKLPATHRRQT